MKRYFTVQRRDIAYLRFIIESYEGLATLSTVDGKNGTVSLSIPRCFADEVDGLVRALENEIAIKETMFPHGSADPGENNGGRENKGNA
jgi:hypothetical protein